jgi:hypothetical protein
VSAPRGTNLKTNSSLNVNNNQATTASFVPDTAGTYSFEFTAADGCNPVVKRLLTIQASCNSVMSISPLQSSPQFIDYNKGNALTNDFNDLEFKLTGKTNGNCQVISTRWTFKRRTCGAHFLPDARPPPVTAAPVAKGCTPQLRCRWELFDEPCTDLNTNPGYLPPTCNVHTGAATVCNRTKDIGNWWDDQCLPHKTLSFKCRYPGVYTMKYTVDDGCSTDEELVTITCRCQKKIKADAGVDRVSLKQCTGSNTFAYEEVDLTGLVAYDSRDNSIDTVQKCPTAAKADVTCDNVPSGCCPTTNECCAPPCPACPNCPSCPSCPTSTRGGGAPSEVEPAVPGAILHPNPDGDAPAQPTLVTKVSGAAPAKFADWASAAKLPGACWIWMSAAREDVAFKSEDEVQQDDPALVLGVFIPMVAVLVVSVVGNLVLFKRGKSIGCW